MRGKRWLFFALALFLLQTLPFLSYRWLTDESWYAGPGYTISHWHGVSDPGMGPNEPEHTFDARPPGTAIIMAAFFKLFGAAQVPARMGSVFAGLAIVALTFFLMRDLFGELAAILATLIVATDNLVITTARTARPEALTTMAILLGMSALKRYSARGTLWWASVSGLLMALGTMFHVTLFGYILSFGVLFLVIDARAKRFPLRGALLYTGGYAVGLLPYLIWIFTAPNQAGIISFKEEFIGKATQTSLALKVLREAHRYSDLLGFGMLQGRALDSLPVRLPIPLVFLLASYLLWRYCRNWFFVEVALLLPSVLWLVYMANKSSRYLVLLAPIFAMTIGAAASVIRTQPKLQRLMIALAAFVIVAQAGANIYLLRSASKADFTQLAAKLRSVVPPDQTAYGTITFWLAFKDRPYVAYERTTPQMAARDFHARYFILGDRMMVEQSGWDSQYYKELRASLEELTSTGQLVGDFPDPYYGDIRIYRVP